MTPTNLTRAQRYHQAIKNTLMAEWDPIGVREIPGAEDEYDSYVSTIHKMLISRKSKREIFDYLWWLETEHMGLTGDRQATEHFAEKLTQLPNKIDDANEIGS
jgi:hypothetical protein